MLILVYKIHCVHVVLSVFESIRRWVQDGITRLLNQPEQELPLILEIMGLTCGLQTPDRGTKYSCRHISLDPSSLVRLSFLFNFLLLFRFCFCSNVNVLVILNMLNLTCRLIGIGLGMKLSPMIYLSCLIMCLAKRSRRSITLAIPWYFITYSLLHPFILEFNYNILIA